MTDKQANAASLAEKEIEYRAAMERKPGSVQLRVRLAECLVQQERFNEALDIIEACIEKAPRNIRIHRLRARILLNLGRSKDAAHAAMTAVDHAPGAVAFRLLAAQMQLEDLQPGRAQHQLDAALELDPDHAQLRKMKKMQRQIRRMSRQADHRPMDWFLRRFNRRIANVAGEKEEKS